MKFSTQVTLSLLLLGASVGNSTRLFYEDANRKLKDVENFFSITSYVEKPDSTRKLEHKTRGGTPLRKQQQQQQQAFRGYGTHSVQKTPLETEPAAVYPTSSEYSTQQYLWGLCCGDLSFLCSGDQWVKSECNKGKENMSVAAVKDTNSVLPAQLNGPQCPDDKYLATFIVATGEDSTAGSAVYFLNLDDYSTVWAAPLGTLEQNTTYVFQDCLCPNTCYSINVFSPTVENTAVALMVGDELQYGLDISMVEDAPFIDSVDVC